MIYKSITMIEERENLKLKRTCGEIDNVEYGKKCKKQRETFRDIYNFYGKKLFGFVNKQPHKKIERAGTIQSVAFGLYQLIDVCCRINEYDVAIEICDYAIKSLPRNFLNQFDKAKKRVNIYISKNVKTVPTNV